MLGDYLPRFNARFGVPAAQSGLAYRPTAAELDLAGVLCFKYQPFPGRMAKDNTINFGGHPLQLLPGLERPSYARARVEVQERLNGSLVVCYQGQIIASREAPPNPVVLRARHRSNGTQKPRPDSGGTTVQGPVLASQALIRKNGRDSLQTRPGPDHPWRKSGLLTKSLHS